MKAKWGSDGKNVWTAALSDGTFMRIALIGYKDRQKYLAYRNGRYLGSEATLEDAQRRAENNQAKPREYGEMTS